MTETDLRLHRPSRLECTMNELYNRLRIRQLRATNTGFVAVSEFEERSVHGDPSPHHLVWLRNLNRVIEVVLQNEQTLSDMVFLDLGCGAGVPVIHVASRYQFRHCVGLDLQPRLVRDAQRNAAQATCASDMVSFVTADAATTVLDYRRYLLFFFNAFGTSTMEAFLDKNSDCLRQTQSYLALVNDHVRSKVLEHSSTSMIWHDQKRNCSVIRFAR